MPNSPTVPLPEPLKQKIKDALVALSLANLCLLKVSFDLLSDQDRFFTKLPVTTPMLLALAVNGFVLTLLFWLVMQVRRRVSGAWLRLPVHLLFFLLLLYPLDFIRITFTPITDYQIYEFGKQPVVLLGGVALLALLAWWHRPVARAAAFVVAILSPLAIFLLIKLTLVGLGLSHLRECPDGRLQPSLPVRAGQPRVVWIIFDETDYRLAFEQRPAGLQLPEFDRLRQASLFATKAYSPGNYTLFSMPALISGRQPADVVCSDAGELSLTLADTGATTNWGALPSVFSGARALGANTALVGWYIPYGRELAGALNFCEWFPYPPYQPCRGETFDLSLRLQLDSLTETFHLRRMFGQLHRDNLRAALGVATNAAYGLTLLHLPAPHKPGVYLPDQDRFTVGFSSLTQGYFNNLVLADREFGQIRRAMESAGLWDKTWVILSSDHSWRQSGYFDGKRDFRVPFMVKPPGGHLAMDYDKQFNTLVTHDLILAMLKSEITNQPDVANWLDAHGKALMTDPSVMHE